MSTSQMFQSPNVCAVIDVGRVYRVFTAVPTVNETKLRLRVGASGRRFIPGQQHAVDAVELAADERVGRFAVRRVHFVFGRVFEERGIVESRPTDDTHLCRRTIKNLI